MSDILTRELGRAGGADPEIQHTARAKRNCYAIRSRQHIVADIKPPAVAVAPANQGNRSGGGAVAPIADGSVYPHLT